MTNPIFILYILLLLFHHRSSFATFNVLDLGAKSGDSTDALSRAWSLACPSANPSTIYIPPGRYTLRNIHFKGPCKNRAITIRIDGTLVAPPDYRVIASADNWLLFEEADGLSIIGGTLDAGGGDLWACKKHGNSCPMGATTLRIIKSRNVSIIGLSSLDSQMFHIVIHGCENVKLQHVRVSASGDSQNTDGVHVQLSTRVIITDSKIGTGDDCVSIGPGTSNLWIENVQCGPGHGISIGSLGKSYNEDGVENVTIRNVRFENTQNGVRIKTWARASKAYVRYVVFEHAVMVNVKNPIVIDQNYCPHNKNCPGQVSGVAISDVTYRDIHGISATEVAVKFDCSKRSPCQRILMENINLNYANRQSQTFCVNAGGWISGLVEPAISCR